MRVSAERHFLTSRIKILKRVLALFSVVFINVGWAGQVATDWPPTKYPLEDVTLSATRQAGNPAFGRRTVSIHGDGRCLVSTTRPVDEVPCRRLSDEALVELVNEFYRLHFFELRDNYITRRRVFLDNQGSIRASRLRLLDTSSTRLCFRAGDFEKCVTFGKDTPGEFQVLIDRILDLPVNS